MSETLVASKYLKQKTNEKFILQEISYFKMVDKCWLHGSLVERCSENIHH